MILPLLLVARIGAVSRPAAPLLLAARIGPISRAALPTIPVARVRAAGRRALPAGVVRRSRPTTPSRLVGFGTSARHERAQQDDDADC